MNEYLKAHSCYLSPKENLNIKDYNNVTLKNSRIVSSSSWISLGDIVWKISPTKHSGLGNHIAFLNIDIIWTEA